jgi:hypothetical protein
MWESVMAVLVEILLGCLPPLLDAEWVLMQSQKLHWTVACSMIRRTWKS